MPARVLLLLPTRTYRASAFLAAAARLRLEVVVGSDEGSSLGHLMEGRQLVVDLDRPGDVAEGVAYVHMGGGCQGCGMASVTLAQGVRTAILDRFPEITDVRDTTDHAQGANPYYQASKK